MTHRIASLPPDVVIYVLNAPHEKLFGIRQVSNPCTSIDPGSLNIGFLYLNQNAQVSFEIMVQIKQKRGIWVENPSPRSF